MISRAKWTILLIVGVIVGPISFVYALGLFSKTLIPLILAINDGTSKPEAIFIIAAAHIVAAILSSAILCIPLGFFASYKPRMLGAIIGIFTSVLLLSFFFNGPSSVNGAIYLIELAGLLVFSGGCIIFSSLGHRGKANSV
jgi:hypothetical protein